MNWQSLSDCWRAAPSETTNGRVYSTLDDRQKVVYEEWRALWESGGDLAIMIALEKRIYNLEQETNK